VIAEPPFEAGALQLNVTLPLPGLASASVGAPGTVAAATGVATSSPDCAPSPT